MEWIKGLNVLSDDADSFPKNNSFPVPREVWLSPLSSGSEKGLYVGPHTCPLPFPWDCPYIPAFFWVFFLWRLLCLPSHSWNLRRTGPGLAETHTEAALRGLGWVKCQSFFSSSGSQSLQAPRQCVKLQESGILPQGRMRGSIEGGYPYPLHKGGAKCSEDLQCF